MSNVAKYTDPLGRTQAGRIINAFGGARPLAFAIGVTPACVYRWLHPKEVHGTGGVIPSKHHARIALEAKKRRIRLNARHWDVRVLRVDEPAPVAEEVAEGADA